MLRRVAGFSHISVCIAGATTSGAAEARMVADSRSSLSPLAIRAMVAAVAGATTTASAQCASSMWGLTDGWPNISTAGGVPVMAASVCGPEELEGRLGHDRAHLGTRLRRGGGPGRRPCRRRPPR